MEGQSNIIIGLDPIDIVNYIGAKNKKFQAILLQDIEQVMDRESEEFKLVRKIILDSYNNYTRSVVRAILGSDFEYYINK